MGPKARNAILSGQKEAKNLQDLFEKRSHGFVARQGRGKGYAPEATRFFANTTAIPQAVPYRRSSNPFCPVSQNRTGWREYVEQTNLRKAVRVVPPRAENAQHRVQHIMEPKPK